MLNDSISFAIQVRQCVSRLRDSGVSALSGLFDLTSVRLVRLAVTITRNQHDAEDVVQMVLVRVADQPIRLGTADEPWHYLLRMVRNQALLVLRNRKRTVQLDSLIDLRTETTVDEAEQAETFRAVWIAMRELPAAQSEVVVLKIWECLTFEQIGDVLGISPSTAASRYRYALEKLSRQLACQATDETGQVNHQAGGQHG